MEPVALLIILIHSLKASAACEIPLSSENNQKNIDFISSYTQFLYERHNFDTFLIFCENCSQSSESAIGETNLPQYLMRELQIPLIIWGMERRVRFKHQLGLNNLVFIYIRQLRDPLLRVASETLTDLHFTAMMVILKTETIPDSRAIKDFFENCWAFNIINVVLIIFHDNGTTEDLKIFRYSPFPRLAFEEVEEILFDNRMDFILEYINDTRGYIFDTPIFMNPPSVFLTPYEQHHNNISYPYITGTAGRIFHEFTHYVNGTINVVLNCNVSFYSYHKETLLLAALKVIDIGVHPYSGLLPYANETSGSYPIGYTNACIIVPVIPEIHPSDYIYRSLQPTILGILFLELLSLFLVELLRLRTFDFGEGVIYAFGTLLFQAMEPQRFQQRKVLLRVLHLLVVTVNVLVESTFCASLTSLLSTTVYGDQIDTPEDLLRSGLQIMVNRYEKEIYFDSELLPAVLRPRLFQVNDTFSSRNKNKLNTNYAYVATSMEWRKLNLQQQLLWKPKFRLASVSDMCTASYFLRFPMQWDSPFHSALIKFFFVIQESGLLKVWEDRSIYHAISLKLLYYMDNDKIPGQYFDWTYLQKPLLIYGLMMLGAIVCFLVELWLHQRRN
ncbi:uncharacterized protein LOC131805548 [Musca domestica]|uniref:Uncharacterized protein LOC131805548 n=1 Tax=Musca domestica TaxID=7370 RepID=A0ABM3VG90_MUSDO|nr:uncharacterized protein LOC131805548 [Musca domestica]